MNTSLRFGIIAGIIGGGMLMVIVMFGWPRSFQTWLIFAVLTAMLVLSFVRWRQTVNRH